MSSRFTALILGLILAAGCLPLAAQTYSLQPFSYPHLTGQSLYPQAINNRGAVVGYIQYFDTTLNMSVNRAFKRDANGALEQPFEDPKGFWTVATGINDLGVMTGYYINPDYYHRHGFLLYKGVFTDFFLKPPGRHTEILGVNNRGDFVGTFPGTQGKGNHGFVSVNGVVTQFDYPRADGIVPHGIAADGTIVGSAYYANGAHKATWGFLRGPAGRYMKITIPGASRTEVLGINTAAHKVVGCYDYGHGFVYDYVTGTITNVEWPDPNTSYTVITGINSSGVIVEWARVNGQGGAFGFIGTPQ